MGSPYDPDVDYEPPFNPVWAKAHNELQYVTGPRYREWLDRELGDLAACAKRWYEVAEAELQMRLPFPKFARGFTRRKRLTDIQR